MTLRDHRRPPYLPALAPAEPRAQARPTVTIPPIPVEPEVAEPSWLRLMKRRAEERLARARRYDPAGFALVVVGIGSGGVWVAFDLVFAWITR